MQTSILIWDMTNLLAKVEAEVGLLRTSLEIIMKIIIVIMLHPNSGKFCILCFTYVIFVVLGFKIEQN